MNRLIVAIFLLSVVIAEKEKVSDSHIDKIADKLARVIEKRLNRWGLDENDGLSNEEDDCGFTYNNGSIIRTQDSITAGATFIKSPVVNTKESCEELCCEIANCNLAVYKDKEDEESCYLFDCGSPSVCLFTSHPGFVSMEIPKRQSARRHEADLENLAAPTTAPSTTSSTTTTEPTTTTQPTTTVEAVKQPVSLFGACKTHKDCAGSATECLADYCVCQEGYHAQDGACHPDKVVKEEEDKVNVPSRTKPQEGNNQPDEEDSNDTDPTPGVSETEKPPRYNYAPSSSSEPSEPDAADKSDATEPKSTDVVDSNNLPTAEHDIIVVDSEESQPNSNIDVTNNNDNDLFLPGKAQIDVSSSGGDNTNDVEVTRQEDDDDNADDGVGEETVYIKTSVLRQNQSAVVALSLGLVLTFLLLLFVGCRLRNMKRRLRKGRPLNSNEADYLINGMYL